ncbi:MAG: hypothetical protein ACM3VV_01790 [Deltaproteobacteria bacterium]
MSIRANYISKKPTKLLHYINNNQQTKGSGNNKLLENNSIAAQWQLKKNREIRLFSNISKALESHRKSYFSI